MPAGQYLTDIEKGQIIGYYNSGKSQREIGRLIGRSQTVVKNFLRKKENYGIKKPTKGNSKLSPSDKRQILRTARAGNLTSTDIKAELEVSVTPRTIRNVLSLDPNLKFGKMKSKPQLTEKHKKARLEFARKYMLGSEFWKSVIFSDEKKFNLDGPDGLHSYWHDIRKEPELLSRRVQGGGSVIIWAGFGYRGITDIGFVKPKSKSHDYQEMLHQQLLPVARNIGGKNWIFQQDNASIHNSRSTKSWFSKHKVRVLDWPSKSPDLNPIENLWGILVRAVYKNGRQFDSVPELKAAIKKAWTEIPDETLEKLVNSMQNRIFEVVLNKGGPTRY
jgi:transposase